MRLVGRQKLDCLDDLSPDERLWVNAWMSELEYVQWGDADDLFKYYPKAVEIESNIYRFYIKNTTGYVEVRMSFMSRIAMILAMKLS